MKLLTGEFVRSSEGYLMPVYNEKVILLRKGDKIVFDKKVYTITDVLPQTGPMSKQSIRIEAEQGYEKRLFKCFHPPRESKFIAGEAYEWTWCVDGVVVIDDSGVEQSFGIYEVFQYFSVITGW